jgi:hypothetical protein
VSTVASTRTILIQARLAAEVWKNPVKGASGEYLAFELEKPMAALQMAVDGKRAIRTSTDTYGYVRARCSCGWPGSPWSGTSHYPDGRALSARDQAEHEFTRHECSKENDQ